jgi:hypothetical protein
MLSGKLQGTRQCYVSFIIEIRYLADLSEVKRVFPFFKPSLPPDTYFFFNEYH